MFSTVSEFYKKVGQEPEVLCKHFEVRLKAMLDAKMLFEVLEEALKTLTLPQKVEPLKLLTYAYPQKGRGAFISQDAYDFVKWAFVNTHANR